MQRIVENGKTYVIRQGKRIEIKTLPGPEPKKTPRKPFEAEWVKLPRRWIKALRQTKSANTYHLALALLAEAFKRQHVGGDIVLSSTVTGIPRCTKLRAARELVELGLITLDQRKGNQACRVFIVYY